MTESRRAAPRTAVPSAGGAAMALDVALVPAAARTWPETVCVVVDELRASSTITTWLDLGCSTLYLTRGLAEARRLAGQHGALLAGERRGLTPRGFDVNNSPAALARLEVAGRPGVLSTSNGTAVLSRLRHMPAVLVGCLLNASAVAVAALELAVALDRPVGIVCAGVLGRFAFDDAYAAGVIADRLLAAAAAAGTALERTDATLAVRRLAASWPDPIAALEASASGHLVHAIGQGEDVAFCGRVDVSSTVPVLWPDLPLRVEPLERP